MALGRPPRPTSVVARWRGRGEPVPPSMWPPQPAWIQSPSELGVAASTRAVLLQTDQLVIALVDCVAYSTGFEFVIAIRSPARDARLRGLFGPRDEQDEGQFRVAITYADGASRSVGNRPAPELMEYFNAAQEGRAPTPPTGPVVMQRSGSADDRRADFRYWCWPLPPEGTMTVSVQWKAAGVPLTEARVDGSAIRRAGASSQMLWPN
jgi:hypothetical protein